MKSILFAIAVFLFAFCNVARADTALVVANCGTLPAGVVYALLQQKLITMDTNGNLCTVGGSFTVSLGGFTPSSIGARGTPLSVTTSDSSGPLPTGTVDIVANVGTTNPMYCNVNGIAATTSDQEILAGSWIAFTIPGGVTTLHCIATGGATTANILGGSGLPTGSGGGGGAASAGAATAANQATQITQETAIANNTSGVSTAANQSSQITEETAIAANTATIATNTGAAIPAGTNAIGTLLPIAETAASSGVLKAFPGNLFTMSVDAVTATTDLKLLLFNSTTLPADGTVTPYKCISFKGDGTQASFLLSWSPDALAFSTGISAAVSSATACTTKTNVTATISGQVQ